MDNTITILIILAVLAIIALAVIFRRQVSVMVRSFSEGAQVSNRHGRGFVYCADGDKVAILDLDRPVQPQGAPAYVINNVYATPVQSQQDWQPRGSQTEPPQHEEAPEAPRDEH